MKRVISLLVIAALAFSVFAISAFADDADMYPSNQFILFDADVAEEFATEGVGVTGSVSEEGYLHLTVEPGNNDPQYNLSFAGSDADGIACEDYPVLAISLRVVTPGKFGGGEAFMLTSSVSGATGGYSRTYSLKYDNEGEFQTIIIDGSKNKTFRENAEEGDEWLGLRWDILGDTMNSEVAVEFDVQWIAFFKTSDAAKAFNGDFSSIPTPSPTPVRTPTPAPTATPTPAPTAEQTAAPTEAPAKSGCGSTIAGTVSVLLLGAVMVMRKKH